MPSKRAGASKKPSKTTTARSKAASKKPAGKKAASSKAAQKKTANQAAKAEIDTMLDEALVQMGGVLGNLGFAPADPGPHRLTFPSGNLAICDIAAIPALGHVGPVRRAHRGKTATRGHVMPISKPWMETLTMASLGDLDQWAMSPDWQVKAVRGIRKGIIAPISGVLAVGDATAIARLAGLPATGEPVPGGTPLDLLKGHLDAGKIVLAPRALELAARSAPTGVWFGTVAQARILVLHIGAKAPVWLRRGLDANGQDASLYIDAASDHVMADPVLRKLALREKAAFRRSKAKAAAEAPV